MELTCSRCHQTVQDGYRFCPECGLPQLVYSAENFTDTELRDRRGETVRDANSVEWRSAVRTILPLAIPAGIVCSLFSPIGIYRLLLMGVAAAWAVLLYTRGQRPAWVTTSAGARIGLVTGVVGGWTAAVATGVSFYAMRFWVHQGGSFDSFWQNLVNQQQTQGIAMGVDAQTLAAGKAMLNSAEGRAGLVLAAIAFLAATLLLFATAGGAVGARMLARPQRPGN